MTEKKCTHCGLIKLLDQFYKHPHTKDGRLGKCKDCARKATVKNREAKRDYYLAYDKQRARTENRRLWRKKRLEKERISNPIANRARRAVATALRNGSLKKGECHCGETKVEAHHPDYGQPLFVIWLCNRHHKHIHGRKAI